MPQEPEESKNIFRISYSGADLIIQCPRKFFYNYEMKIVPKKGAVALRWGNAWHGIQAVFFQHVKQFGWNGKNEEGQDAMNAAIQAVPEIWKEACNSRDWSEVADDFRQPHLLVDSFIQYLDKWLNDPLELVIKSVENYYDIDFKVTEEELQLFPELKGTSIRAVGIIDRMEEVSGFSNWAKELKSTGAWIGNTIDMQQRSPQTIGYYWAAKQIFGDYIEGVIVDVFQCSSQRKKDGTWGKINQVFERIPVLYSEDDVKQWRLSVLDVVSRMKSYRNKKFFPMNFSSCFKFGNKPCEYLELCYQSGNPEELYLDNFQTKKPRSYNAQS